MVGHERRNETFNAVKDWLEGRAESFTTGDPTIFAEYVVQLLGTVPFVDDDREQKELLRIRVVDELKGIVERTLREGPFLEQLWQKVRETSSLQPITVEDSSTILVTNVPRPRLNIRDVREAFEPYGRLALCRADLERRQLLIGFKHSSCAIRCVSAKGPFFGNRFIKVELCREQDACFEGVDLMENENRGQDGMVLTNHASVGQSTAQQERTTAQKLNQQMKNNQEGQLRSKEKLLQGHRSMLQLLAERIGESGDNEDELQQHALEFERIRQSMVSLNILPAEMVKKRIERFLTENPERARLFMTTKRSDKGRAKKRPMVAPFQKSLRRKKR
ncbi:LAMI_0A08372g1_1 [Lachancea mirantina]|uniref:LAMI_0A08372g1_1 n=1 Tax=Lachancea mirantina TaxID=1230905 RepID=A0A1G4IRF5_9SACH|nr:LAMI_0A08372g1_1 [Lachancea mirantina]